jgi:hypothetical protein
MLPIFIDLLNIKVRPNQAVFLKNPITYKSRIVYKLFTC